VIERSPIFNLEGRKMKTWQIVALGVLAPTIAAGIWLVNAPATKAVALVDKATDTTKMLANYEWFHEASTNFNARVNQIKSHKTLIANETDKAELSRLRMEAAAVQQTCRDLVAKYAAKTNQVHVGYLKGKSLPEALDAGSCE
jgi:hypothetical protein